MKLIELEEVDSTNDYLKREYQNLPMQTCVTAKYQTKGRMFKYNGYFSMQFNRELRHKLSRSIKNDNYDTYIKPSRSAWLKQNGRT